MIEAQHCKVLSIVEARKDSNDSDIRVTYLSFPQVSLEFDLTIWAHMGPNPDRAQHNTAQPNIGLHIGLQQSRL